MRTKTFAKEAALLGLIASLASGAAFAQRSIHGEHSEIVVPFEDSEAAAPEIIFSNVESIPGEQFNSNQFSGFAVAGISAIGVTETWEAIRFIPKVDTQAKLLEVAIGYISGTKLVNLGIYSNDETTGRVGDPLPGGQGSVKQIPDAGSTCCPLVKVRLPEDGVLLTAGTKYWLVASPDDVNAPDFSGIWHLSNLSHFAATSPSTPWEAFPGQWLAAEIRGSNMPAARAAGAKTELSRSESSSGMTLFANLAPLSVGSFDPVNGLPIDGKSVISGSEVSYALSFRPQKSGHARTLSASVGYISGTKLVNLGLYSDNGGVPGVPLANGEGSTTDIPDSGECCALAQVTLPAEGAALSKGVQYWLVASADDMNGADFRGVWRFSLAAVSAFQEPENFLNWDAFDAGWLGAEIRGTSP